MRTILLGLCLLAACGKDDPPPPVCSEGAGCCPDPDNCPEGLICDPIQRLCVERATFPDAGVDAPG